MENFLRKLQSLDESVKTKILIASSAVIFFVILFFWLKYFALVVQQAAPAQAVSTQSAPSPSFSFLGMLKTGAAGVYHFAADKIAGLFQIIKAPKSYIIEP